jgi:hypothetical protein
MNGGEVGGGEHHKTAFQRIRFFALAVCYGFTSHGLDLLPLVAQWSAGGLKQRRRGVAGSAPVATYRQT